MPAQVLHAGCSAGPRRRRPSYFQGLPMSTERFGPSELDRLAAELNRDGICVIRGLFDRGLVAEWAAAFDALFRQRQSRPGGLAPREQARYYLTFPWVTPFA